jgi:uncharacterized protein (UPF0276 family)
VQHYARALEAPLDVDWVEALTENFFGAGGRPLAVLRRVRKDRPIVFHGVSLGVGNLEPAGAGYLAKVRALIDEFEPPWISDHLCWGALESHFSHDLLPLPYTEEALALTVDNVRRARDTLGCELLLENVSSYVEFRASAMPEWDFLAEVSERADCRILLDLNNVIVNATNHSFDPKAFLDGLPAHRVWQLHLANHTDRGKYKLDSHRGKVPDSVWELYEHALGLFGPVSSLVEWDDDVPDWETLAGEQRKAKNLARRLLGATGVAA